MLSTGYVPIIIRRRRRLYSTRLEPQLNRIPALYRTATCQMAITHPAFADTAITRCRTSRAQMLVTLLHTLHNLYAFS